MSKNGLHRHYGRLSGEERFRLDVLAMARGDMQESERLVGSCPRATYTMTERTFGARWRGVEDATLRTWMGLGDHLAKLLMVDAFREMVPYHQTLSENMVFDAYYKGHEAGSYHAWNHAGKTGYPPAWPKGDDPEEIWEPDEDEQDPAMERDEGELQATVDKYGGFLPEVLDKMERECVKNALSVWTGYADFCAESVGVAAEKVAAVILEPAMGRIEDMKLRAGRLGVEPDRGAADEVRDGLSGLWETRLKRGV